MKEFLGWPHEFGIVAGVIASIIAALIVAVFVFALRHIVTSWIVKALPQLESRIPHINFELNDKLGKNGEWESIITVSNAGEEPVYNIYVFYFEQFPDGNFKITAANTDNLITRPVLGIHDSLKFYTKGVRFEGCNVTCLQEI